jgi:hypothetical protein
MSSRVLRSLGFTSRVLPLVIAAALAATTTLVLEPAAHAQGTRRPAKNGAPHKGDAKPAPAASAPPAAAPPPVAAAPAAPPPEEPKPAEPPAEEEKEKARAIYISLDLGFTAANIGAFSDSTGFDHTGATGLLAGIGVGYRAGNFRIGGRFRDTNTTQYSLWSLMGEVGYGLGTRPISPLFLLHAGYMFDTGVERGAFEGSLPRGTVLPPDVSLKGLVVGGEVTANYWFTSFLRMGPFIGVDATVLSRAKADLPRALFPITDETRNNALFSGAGTGIGYMLSIGIRGTGDIAF